jgi:hypothetical protein
MALPAGITARNPARVRMPKGILPNIGRSFPSTRNAAIGSMSTLRIIGKPPSRVVNSTFNGLALSV